MLKINKPKGKLNINININATIRTIIFNN